MAERQFPIINAKGIIRSVPWRLVEPHRARAESNHGQSLEKLAHRGGLSWEELFAIMQDLSWRDFENLCQE